MFNIKLIIMSHKGTCHNCDNRTRVGTCRNCGLCYCPKCAKRTGLFGGTLRCPACREKLR